MERDQNENSTSPQATVIEEWNGTSSTKLTKTATITATSSSSISIKRSSNAFTHISQRILQAFVPEGFPSSVTPDYVPFQVWDSLQGLSTYVRMMLSTQALLSAIGVGEKSATVIGATFQWFLRDLTGMVGGVLFTCYQGSNLDSNAKMWRLVADLMNDLGMLMDLVSPLFPSAFVFIVCLGSLSRSFTNYMAVCSLSLNTLNCERCSIVLSQFFKTGQVLSPKQVSSMEHVLPSRLTSWTSKSGDSLYKRVHLGVRVSSLDSLAMVNLLQSAGSNHKKAMYLLQQERDIINIITHKDSTAADILQSFIHALVMAKLGDQGGSMSLESQSWMDKHYEVFLLKLQSSGWKTERLLSSSVVWKANWLAEYSDGKLD
ncbi:PREDICTED: protein root UVB sensitive 3 isoform X2 [Nicotiana attenuata]|uniref:protein root UVB sensitive 3 isoform X2 n=1 Tax=Nicotiana attenuata TaxID=49451 RepID=UPI0009047E23|nr:PREDICTED: protein root UVB sensitive 3 isoform X2 [Nicotiana attenuata]